MSEYPEALIEKVAKAIRDTDPATTRGYLSEGRGHSDSRAYAAAALDALGLREEWATSLTTPVHRYATAWEDA